MSSPFFLDKLANGYSNPTGSVVYSINGTHVRSLKHLVALLRDLKDPFVTIEFDQKGNEALVFARAAVLAATDDILTDNGVRAQGSPNMMEVWQERRGSRLRGAAAHGGGQRICAGRVSIRSRLARDRNQIKE